MFRNYVTIALRSLRRQKGYAVINLAGLTLGLACCLLLFQYVAFEYSFDRFHANEADLYRVLQTTPLVGEAAGTGGDDTGFALGPALAEGVPEVVRAARLHPEDDAVVSSPAHPGRVFEETRAFYTDPAFLAMFSFPLMAGTAETALAPGTVLLSASAAAKYFGTADPVGQVLDVAGATAQRYRVAGVFRDVPANSHLQFDLLLPVDDLLRAGYADEPEGGWAWNNFNTYVQLRPGADPAAVARKMEAVYRAHRGEALRAMARTVQLSVQPLRDIHLNSEITARHTVMGSYRTVYFFTLIGLVTLVIALVNYVNLATARAMERAREVGVRKAVGAQRGQLVAQFLAESALTILAAFVLAAALAAVLRPAVDALAGTSLADAAGRAVWARPAFWGAFLATFLAATLLAGLYPAFVLSAFRPVAVLKGKAGRLAAGAGLRRGLVVAQFAACIVLLVGTAVVYAQLAYLRALDLGMALEQVLTVEAPRVLPAGTDPAVALAPFLQELRRLPAVRQVATSTSLPGQGFTWRGVSIRRAEDDPAAVIPGVVTAIDTAFAGLYGLDLVAGRGFEAGTVPAAADASWPVLAGETAVRALGFASPADAVGQALDLGGHDAYLAGVFGDVHWSSAHAARPNLFFRYTDAGEHVSLRVATDDLPGTLAAVEGVYDRLFPGNVFSYAFVDEAFDRQYRDDRRFATLFGLFAALAIVIACLGLFGLAAFTAAQRTKEIGVRKVLGASVGRLVALLAGDFLKLVGVAFVLAVPLASFVMERWLDNFAYRIGLPVWAFVLTGLAILGLTLLTVGYQAIRAALADPVESLRYE